MSSKIASPQSLQSGVTYHIYNRGNNGEILFREEQNYLYFMRLYKKYIPPIADTFSFCLLSNHFHFLVKIKDWQSFNPFGSFSNLFSTYSKAFNKRYNRTGSLFEKPFRRKIVTHDKYFTNLVVYIHRNPQIHGFVENFKEWPYSSYQEIVKPQKAPIVSQVALEWFGSLSTFIDQHTQPLDLAFISE